MSTVSNWQFVAQVVGVVFALLGGTGGVVAFLKTRGEVRKLDADAVAVVSDAASRAVLRAEGELARLEARVRTLETDLDRSNRKVRELEGHVDTLTRKLTVTQTLLDQHNIRAPWST